MIDAAIPLQTQAPQITPLLQQLNQASNIQQQQQNLQTGAIKQQGDQLTLNQQQQDAQDKADIRSGYAGATDPATGQVDSDKLVSILSKLNPAMAAQTSANLNAQNTAAQEAKAKLGKAQADAVTAHLDLKDRLLQGTTAATWANTRAIALQSGFSPQEIPEQYPGDAWVAQAHAQTLSQQQQITNMQAAQKEKDAAAQAAATLANTQQNERAQRSQEQQRIGIEGGRLGLEQKKFNLENGTATDANGNNIVDAIGTGHISPARMDYLLARNPALLQGVVAKYPDFDSSKAAAYPATYKDFTSGKTSVALNAAGTALGHMQELQALNTLESRIPGTADYQKYQNKLATLAPELAKFYGNDTIPGIAGYKDTLGSIFNRGAAIQTQAQSMGDKLDAYQQQWDNAAPSKSYQAPMPGISPKALAARVALDPNYKTASTQTTTASGAGGNQPQGAPQPGTSGLGVKLSDAMQLPQNKGKTAQQVTADIQAHGHTVIQ